MTIVLRNLLIAPTSEEILFRAILTPTLFLQYNVPVYFNNIMNLNTQTVLSVSALLYLCPLFFSVAHIHHLYEKIRRGMSVSRAVQELIIQSMYTYIFGYIAMILYVRTGNVFSCICSHIICNFMGLPDTSFMNEGPYSQGEYSVLFSYRYVLLLLHALGLVMFTLAIYPMTFVFTHTSIYS